MRLTRPAYRGKAAHHLPRSWHDPRVTKVPTHTRRQSGDWSCVPANTPLCRAAPGCGDGGVQYPSSPRGIHARHRASRSDLLQRTEVGPLRASCRCHSPTSHRHVRARRRDDRGRQVGPQPDLPRRVGFVRLCGRQRELSTCSWISVSAQIEDVKCAIRYLRSTAPRYGLDGTEIFAFGTSVGGQLVALAALTGPDSLYDVGSYPTESSALRAVADLFGPANLTQPASGFTPSGIEQVFGRNDRRELLLASPTHFVVSHSPPILLVQGVEDTKVLESQSIELYRDLEAAGDSAQLVLVRNMGHMFVQAGSRPIDPSLSQIAHEVASYFNQQRNM